jgi:hypothetical protein
MTPLGQLQNYLRRLQLRLQVLAAARGTAVVLASALAFTLVLTWIANRLQFAEHLMPPLRILLFAAVALTISFLLVVPLLRLNKRRITRLAERRVPSLEERLITVSERPDPDNPFTELLAEDALRIVSRHQPDEFAPVAWVAALAVCAVLAGGFLLWMVASGPGYWGYGASLLWTGKARAAARPLYEIVVRPGDRTVRRKSDQLITARLSNFSAPEVTLHAKYHGALNWQETPMQPEQNSNGYKFLLPGLSEGVEYYVQAGSMRSKHYMLKVKDLASVKRVKVTVHFPSALDLKDTVEDPGGDVRTVQGSLVDISVLTDRPLERGVLMLDDGSKLALTRGEGNWLNARLAVQKDGSYHIAAVDSNEAVRISDDYFIEAKKDEAPSVKILRPGRDPHVSPIEEVPVSVEAADDFGVSKLDLHYSVNGGPEQVLPLSKGKVAKQAEGKTTLDFENFKLVPGDLVSFYATARDATKTSRSDIVFAQAEPFDYQFRQSQQSGGGGGMPGGDNDQISERQKDIIIATWNEIKNGSRERNAITEEARFLSQLQGKLGEQAKTMAQRMGSRELVDASPEFAGFSKSMIQASEEMSNSVGELKGAKWQNALAPEQRALQSLLRAEAMFRNIQVAFGQRGSQGMGGSGSQRDLERMLDLELDKNKNQYETGDSASSSSAQQKAMDEALQRLKLLAQRQQELAAQRQQEQAFEQRWQEEQLRREAEQLRQQMQQLAQNSSGEQNDSSSQQQGARRSASSSGQAPQMRRGRASSQSGSPEQQQSAEAIKQAMQALQRAEDEMRKSVSGHDASAQRRAAQQLAEAESLMKNRQHQQAGGTVSEMAQRAQQIADRQKEIVKQLRHLYGIPEKSGLRSNDDDSGSADGSMPAMRDPDSGYGRWYWRQLQAQPRRPTSGQEKAIADDKEKLGEQLEQLQRQMQQQAQQLQAEQPGISSRVRKALSGAQQDELALRMKKTAEWMRDGFGARSYGMEESLTKGVDQLSRDLHSAQQTLAAGKGGDQDAANQKEMEALNQVRKLRQQLDAQAQAGQQKSTTRSGSGGNATPYSSIGDTVNALSGLRQQLGPRDRDFSRQLEGALGGLRHLNDSRSGELEARLNREILPSLERLEIALNRRVSEQNQSPRTAAPELAPESYRDAVAQYFRKLSR